MRKFIVGALAAAALGSFAPAASAQTACKYITPHNVLTNAQWNYCFQQKQDGLGYTAVNKAGDVMTGRLVTAPTSGSLSGFNLTPGSAPISPADGDLWATTTGVYARINGSTVGPFNAAPANPTATAGPTAVNGSASTFMRSDAAPKVQLGTNAAQGIVQGDTSTVSCAAGVCSAVRNGILPTPTRAGDILYWNGTAWVTIAGNNSGIGILAEGAAGGLNWFKPASLQSAVLGSVTTSSTSEVMAGFGSSCTITPTLTGRLRISFVGWVSINTSTSTINFEIRYGTGTPPAAGVASTGTAVGTNSAANITPPNVMPIALSAVVTGLSAGTTYWFDMGYKVVSNSGTVGQASCNANEF